MYLARKVLRHEVTELKSGGDATLGQTIDAHIARHVVQGEELASVELVFNDGDWPAVVQAYADGFTASSLPADAPIARTHTKR